ncbi:unnamed protein product [Musa acuminata var. zebrina]
MTGFFPGRRSSPPRRSGRCRCLLRAGTPLLRVLRGPSASPLHKGRVGVFGPTSPMIKLVDVKGIQMKKSFWGRLVASDIGVGVA